MSTRPRDRPRPLGIPWQMLPPHILEECGKRLSFSCSVWYREESRTDESRNKEGRRVWEWRRYLKKSPFTWWNYFKPKKADSFKRVDSKGATVPGYGRSCFRKELRISNGPFGSRHAVRACSEHKSANIFKMGSICCYVTLKCCYL